jgi:hypothetical protein
MSVRVRFLIATFGAAALLVVSQQVKADPITTFWSDTAHNNPNSAPLLLSPSQTDFYAPDSTSNSAQGNATIPARNQKHKETSSSGNPQTGNPQTGNPQTGAGANPDARAIPQIPWEAIELEIRRNNAVSPARKEPDIVLDSAYRQLVLETLPEFPLDITFLETPTNIPMLDLLRTQSTSLTLKILPYANALSSEAPEIAMASNGNLGSPEDDITRPDLIENVSKLPFQLKNLLYWGLGLLVLYSILEALFSRLRRQRNHERPDNDVAVERAPALPRRRRRSFRRSRRKSA